MRTVTATKANISKLLVESQKPHKPIRIKGKEFSSVLISYDDWRSIQETLHLLSIPKMRESIRRGLETPVEKCSRVLSWTNGHSSAPKRHKKMPRNSVRQA
ncbi:MAG TPA: type II toxin-antitoxin system Phd/YefM family antitoxin [Bacteroidota bacterium]|nr:type II toxin-antitoxin system Phd/YefM family antitoxin [Bacteroidota bacterium]